MSSFLIQQGFLQLFFTCFHLRFIIFWQKEIGKMLVKWTRGLRIFCLIFPHFGHTFSILSLPFSQLQAFLKFIKCLYFCSPVSGSKPSVKVSKLDLTLLVYALCISKAKVLAATKGKSVKAF